MSLEHIKDNPIIKTDHIEQTAHFIAFIFGIWNGKFEFCEFIAKQLGCFDNDKVQVLIRILKRNKKNIFGGAVYGLPKMTYNTDTMPSKDQIYQLSKQAAATAIEYGTDYVTSKGKCDFG